MTFVNAIPARVDTHVHVMPPSFALAVREAGGDSSGWIAPDWNPQAMIHAADALGVSLSVLSVASPGPALAGTGKAGRELARKCNEEVQDLVRHNPARFAFFASTPSWEDVAGTVAEIDYIFQSTDALGIVAMTQYGERLLGNPKFAPIWQKLEEYRAVVFIHPAVSRSVDEAPSCSPPSVVDSPIAVTRTAIDLAFSGTVCQHSHVKIILAHGGGVLANVASSVASIASATYMSGGAKVPTDELYEVFKKFYLEVSLSADRATLNSLLSFTAADKLLFGSDLPDAPGKLIHQNTSDLDSVLLDRPAIWYAICRDNALKLLAPRMRPHNPIRTALSPRAPRRMGTRRREADISVCA